MSYNSVKEWDRMWSFPPYQEPPCYLPTFHRIRDLTPKGSRVFDLGCGCGVLLDILKNERECETLGCDFSPVAVELAGAKGHEVFLFDLVLDPQLLGLPDADIYIATETLEHLPLMTVRTLLARLSSLGKKALFAVPNNCLSPEEEPQHYHCWTALSFLQLLREFWPDARVECIDDDCAPYRSRLLGVCGFPKPFKLAFTMPVKNEAEDIERVLKSFRGAADVMVIGVDDTTTDATKEIALRYAEVVFDFTWEKSFAAARNACLERCRPLLGREDWIFMCEGHEHLEAGLDDLLLLNRIPAAFRVLEICRQDRSHRWHFPWLFRNHEDIFFENAVHNRLNYDSVPAHSSLGQLPSVRTLHTRASSNSEERRIQRFRMNRQELLRKVIHNPTDTRSLFYLAQEWSGQDRAKAIDYYRRYLTVGSKYPMESYQARMDLAHCLLLEVERLSHELRLKESPHRHPQLSQKESAERRQQISAYWDEAYAVLAGATADDWERNEHWLALGDMCFVAGRHEEAIRFYEMAALAIGTAPRTFMWISRSAYAWLPAQKLVAVYADCGRLEKALQWCDKVLSLLPDWAPPEAREEAEQNRTLILEQLEATHGVTECVTSPTPATASASR